jgi:hypothetical protein
VTLLLELVLELGGRLIVEVVSQRGRVVVHSLHICGGANLCPPRLSAVTVYACTAPPPVRSTPSRCNQPS